MTTIEGGNSPLGTVLYIILGIVFVAFLAYIPFALINKEERREKAWQETGCRMYDEKRISEVPAKCVNQFTEHYAPQEEERVK